MPYSTHADAEADILSRVSKNGGDTITASGAAVKGLVVKGAASQTANLLEIQDSAGVILSRIGANGFIEVGHAGTFISALNGRIQAQPRDPAVVALTARGASGQAANLTEWRDSADTVLASVNSVGRVTTAQLVSLSTNASEQPLFVKGVAGQTANLAEFQNSAATVVAYVDSNGAIGSAGLFTGGSGFIGGRLSSQATSAGDRPLVVRGAASQTANLAEFQNSAGTVLASIGPSGGLTVGNLIDFAAVNDVTNAIAGSATLPSNPQGFLQISIAGVVRRIPYYRNA